MEDRTWLALVAQAKLLDRPVGFVPRPVSPSKAAAK